MIDTTKVCILYKTDIIKGIIFLVVNLAVLFLSPLFLLLIDLRYKDYFASLFFLYPPFFIFTIIFIIILAITVTAIYQPIKDHKALVHGLDKEISTEEENTIKEKRRRYKIRRILTLVLMIIIVIIAIYSFIFLEML